MSGAVLAIWQKIVVRFEIGLFACVWLPLCMRVAAPWAKLASNKSLNKKMKTQLTNLKFHTTLVLVVVYS